MYLHHEVPLYCTYQGSPPFPRHLFFSPTRATMEESPLTLVLSNLPPPRLQNDRLNESQVLTTRARPTRMLHKQPRPYPPPNLRTHPRPYYRQQLLTGSPPRPSPRQRSSQRTLKPCGRSSFSAKNTYDGSLSAGGKPSAQCRKKPRGAKD